MGVCGVFFGCRGVTGFNGCCSGASSGDGGFTVACMSGCSGDVGFNVATWLCPVREFVRPVRPDGGREREIVRPAGSKHPNFGSFARVGRVFSRMGRWRVRCWANFVAGVPGGSVAGRTLSRVRARRPRLGWCVHGLAAVCKPRRHPRQVLWVPEGGSECGGGSALHTHTFAATGNTTCRVQRSVRRSARGRGPGRSRQQISSDN